MVVLHQDYFIFIVSLPIIVNGSFSGTHLHTFKPIYAHHENLNDELRNDLIERLEHHKIPYQVDEDGNVKIPEEKLRKAVMCCS